MSFHPFERRRAKRRVAAPRTDHAPRTVRGPVASSVGDEAIAASPFTALGLTAPLVRAVLEEAYELPSPVQAAVIPHALRKRDIIGCAQTGTGKTAAFLLPVLQQLAQSTSRSPRALILTPTRELAIQIAESAAVYGRHLSIRHAAIYGGVSQRSQEIALTGSPDVIVATPGRLLDLLGQRLVDLRGIVHFVLDEADRMLDMGFVHDVRRIVAMLPTARQTLFFSATMAPEVEKLARTMLVDPERISISPTRTTADTVEQSVVFVPSAQKQSHLEGLLNDQTLNRAIVFTRTKRGANRLSEQLERAGIGSVAIHGNKSQGARTRALEAFRQGTTRVLVATDIAARGIDVDGVCLVVNFDIPNVAESYVHRIGRTGRAGATGRAVSLCDDAERPFLADIERLIGRRLTLDGPGPTSGAEVLRGDEVRSARESASAYRRPRRGRRYIPAR